MGSEGRSLCDRILALRHPRTSLGHLEHVLPHGLASRIALFETGKSPPGRLDDGIDDEIDKITHENVFRLYRFDGMERAGGREQCNVGALRKLGAHVDTREVSLAGKAPRAYAAGKVVTSGDALAALGG